MTKTADVFDDVDAIVADVLRVDRREFDDQTRFGDDVAMESLDYVEIAETIEFELRVVLEDDDLEAIETVGDLKTLVRRRAGE